MHAAASAGAHAHFRDLLAQARHAAAMEAHAAQPLAHAQHVAQPAAAPAPQPAAAPAPQHVAPALAPQHVAPALAPQHVAPALAPQHVAQPAPAPAVLPAVAGVGAATVHPVANHPASLQLVPGTTDTVYDVATRNLDARGITAHYDLDDPNYLGYWYLVTRGRRVGVFRSQ